MENQHDDSLDLRELFRLVLARLPLLVGLSALGLALGLAGNYYLQRQADSVSRIYFTVPTLVPTSETTPAPRPWAAADLLQPEILQEAIARSGLSAEKSAATLRPGLSVSEVMSFALRNERERRRAAGAPLLAFVPQEYVLILEDRSLTETERSRVITEIIRVYADRPVPETPVATGQAFEQLVAVDYPDYEQVIQLDLANLDAALRLRGVAATRLDYRLLSGKIKRFLELDLAAFAQQVAQSGATKHAPLALVRARKKLLEVREEMERLEQQQQEYAETISYLGQLPQAEAAALDTPSALNAPSLRSVLVGRFVEKTVDTRISLARSATLVSLLEKRVVVLRELGSAPVPLPPTLQVSFEVLKGTYDQIIQQARALLTEPAGPRPPAAVISESAFSTPPPPSWSKAALLGLTFGFTVGLALTLLPLAIGRKG